MQNHPIIKQIQQSNYLPKIPKAFGDTLTMLLEPCEFNIDECIDKLCCLPQLETALIQFLNYYSKLNREILTLKDAVLYLGAKNTRMIAIAHITRLMLPNRYGRTQIFDNKKYWKHCIGTSIASYLIAAETGLCDKDKIFTYGLIHDIGITVLDICLPNLLDKIHTMVLEKGLHQIVAEKVVLNGITHTEIGMWLCREWGLPEEISEIVGYHHFPLLYGKPSNEVKIMYLADAISTNYYNGLIGTPEHFIHTDKAREELNLSKEFIDGIAVKLPEEVEKIIRTGYFDF
ncbi:MAG TPA: HDOD domain-containing protein [Clostridiaceae bacterium]|nr:HDOD domain-containing protein [Clostridiaceae bacterium]